MQPIISANIETNVNKLGQAQYKLGFIEVWWSYNVVKTSFSQVGLAELGNKFRDLRISAVQNIGRYRHEWFIKKEEDDCSDNNHCFCQAQLKLKLKLNWG